MVGAAELIASSKIAARLNVLPHLTVA